VSVHDIETEGPEREGGKRLDALLLEGRVTAVPHGFALGFVGCPCLFVRDLGQRATRVIKRIENLVHG
jgi:hypothetical protein